MLPVNNNYERRYRYNMSIEYNDMQHPRPLALSFLLISISVPLQYLLVDLSCE